MFAPRSFPLSRQTASQFSRAVAGLVPSHSIATTSHLWCGCFADQHRFSARNLSSTPAAGVQSTSHLAQGANVDLKAESSCQNSLDGTKHGENDALTNVSTSLISKTDPAWPHPGYDVKEMVENVTIVHRKPRVLSDRVALATVRVARWGMDLVSGYQLYNHDAVKLTGKAQPYKMSEQKWLARFVFLETIAGVPGSVAGTLRHLQSIRRLKRDNGWIESLLEESFNERMHLLTFIKLTEPGWFMRMLILGAQGVFYNAFFLCYLVSPRTCHRFVGYLEEEAVFTYSHAIKDLEAGLLPKWHNLEAPQLAVDYWKMPEGHRSMADLLYYIRADEAKHREVNHTLGNLRQKEDPNPFVSTYRDPALPHPDHGLKYMKEKGAGWEREEVI